MNFNYILNQPAFVIHIEELSPNRTNFFKNNITKAGYKDMRIFKGVNRSNIEEFEICIKEFNNIKLHKDLGAGQIGCLFSHLKLYKYIISNNIQVCTIFEDDVHFHPNWHYLAANYYHNTPKNYDLIFIGNQLDECKNNNNIPIINTNSTFCTHAYIITIKGAQKMLTYLLNWDYHKALKDGNNEPLTGLFCIDIMIKNIQDRMNKNQLKKHINWYCWNGTKFPCEYNKLPLKGNDIRNTGLVFQSDVFESTIRNTKTDIYKNGENITIINNCTDIISAYCDKNDITNIIKNIIKYKKNNQTITISNQELIYHKIPIDFENLTISYLYNP